MENAVEALKMAFAVLFFIGALTISMFTFSQARATSEVVLYSKDNRNYEEYTYGNENKNRIVGLDSVILTLYRYYKEDYTVVFKDRNGNYMNLYETTTNNRNWTSGYDYERYGKDKKDKAIVSFDLTEETSRGEPWTGGGKGQKDIKANLDAFISGGTITFNNRTIRYEGIEKLWGTNPKFEETLGTYSVSEIVYKKDKDGNIIYKDGEKVIDYDATMATGAYINVDGELIQLQKQKKKRIIIYTLQ